MAPDYAKMTSDLIARMSRPREHPLCATCNARISDPAACPYWQCAGCTADDSCDDIELEALTLPLLSQQSEVASG